MSEAAQRKGTIVLSLQFNGDPETITAIGIYGVMAYQVTQRRREIAIRMALGAGRRDVLRLVVGHGMCLARPGASMGAFVAIGVGRTISNQLYGVRPGDPSTYLFVGTALLSVAFVAIYLPSRRAANEDPAAVLKYE